MVWNVLRPQEKNSKKKPQPKNSTQRQVKTQKGNGGEDTGKCNVRKERRIKGAEKGHSHEMGNC